MAALHGRADRLAFDAACHLVEADSSADRVLGLDILGQISVLANRPFLEETLPMLIAACADDRTDVLAAAIGALGHVGDPRGLASVLSHAGNSCDDVRLQVAVALPAVAGDPPAADAVAALILLSADADADTRDWRPSGLVRSWTSTANLSGTPWRQG